MHIYIFGSLCRGELEYDSDVDLLICSTETKIDYLDKNKFSIYSYQKLNELWKQGNPFAWHLYLESKLVFSDDNIDYIKSLGAPNEYSNIRNDFYKFRGIYSDALSNLKTENSVVYNLSCIFLAIRNIATCYSLFIGNPIFSRLSMIKIKNNLDIPLNVISILERARVLSTRGIGKDIDKSEVELILGHINTINDWLIDIEGRINDR